jgi:hypothetical protein
MCSEMRPKYVLDELLLSLALDQNIEADHGLPPKTFLSNSCERL